MADAVAVIKALALTERPKAGTTLPAFLFEQKTAL
jgi:hypothetical protein